MFARALRRHRLLVPVVVLVVVGAAGAYALLAPDRYEAEATLLVVPAADPVVRSLASPVDPDTVAELVETPDVADRVAVRLRLDRDDVLDAVDASRAGRSAVVAVRAEARSRERAAQVANAFVDEALRARSGRFQAAVAREARLLRSELAGVPIAQRGERQERLERLRALGGERDPTVVVGAAAVAGAAEHVWPKRYLIVGAAAAGSLLLAVLLAVALEWEPRRATAAADVPPATDAPPAPAASAGAYSVSDLRRRVAAHPRPDADWVVYLDALEEQSGPGGRLPASLDWLVEDVYAELLAGDGAEGPGRRGKEPMSGAR